MRDRGATRALVLGLLAMWFGVFAPFAIVAGASSLHRIRASHGELRGGSAATAGLVAGVVGVLVIVVGLAYLLATS